MSITTDTESDQELRVNIVLDDPRIDGYVVKTLARGTEEDIETFWAEEMNGFENYRYRDAIRSVFETWSDEIKENEEEIPEREVREE